MTKAERRAEEEANAASTGALAHLHGLDLSIGQLQAMLEQIVELREQTIRQTSRDVIQQWRRERGTEKVTGVIRMTLE